MSDQRNDLVATNFLEEINQIIAELDGIQASPTDEPETLPPPEPVVALQPAPETAPAVDTPPPPADATPAADVPRQVYVLNLGDVTARRQVQNWWLSPTDNPIFSLDPDHIVGAVIRTQKGSTSPITGIDPVSRRVLTRSGTVYELGMPEAVFAAKGRLVLRRLGF